MADEGSAHRLRVAVSEEVRVAMARRRINGVELARRLGVSQAWVSRRLSAETPFDVDDLERIARALDVEPAALIPRSERVTYWYPDAPDQPIADPSQPASPAAPRHRVNPRPRIIRRRPASGYGPAVATA